MNAEKAAPNGSSALQKEVETFGAYIQIVGPVFYNRELNDKTKLLYGLLAAMTQAPRYYAFAKNATMMRFLQCSERTLQRCLSALEQAGEIVIEDGSGGRGNLRKIYLARLQPFNPDKNDGANPDKNDGVNNNKEKNKQRRKKAASSTAVSEKEIVEWLDCWVAKLDLDTGESVRLCSDLHAMAENRSAMGDPYLTIRHVVLLTNALKRYSDGKDHPVAVMRFLLQQSVTNNWRTVYDLKEKDLDSFAAFLRDEYGIDPAGNDAHDPVYY